LWFKIVALRGAATLKARALKEVWNIAAVIPVEKNLVGNGNGGGGGGSNGSSNSSFSGELATEDNFLGICSRELLARGCELLKRTRTGIFPILYSTFLHCLILSSVIKYRPWQCCGRYRWQPFGFLPWPIL
jgi:hypothetical protein